MEKLICSRQGPTPRFTCSSPGIYRPAPTPSEWSPPPSIRLIYASSIFLWGEIGNHQSFLTGPVRLESNHWSLSLCSKARSSWQLPENFSVLPSSFTCRLISLPVECLIGWSLIGSVHWAVAGRRILAIVCLGGRWRGLSRNRFSVLRFMGSARRKVGFLDFCYLCGFFHVSIHASLRGNNLVFLGDFTLQGLTELFGLMTIFNLLSGWGKVFKLYV